MHVCFVCGGVRVCCHEIKGSNMIYKKPSSGNRTSEYYMMYPPTPTSTYSIYNRTAVLYLPSTAGHPGVTANRASVQPPARSLHVARRDSQPRAPMLHSARTLTTITLALAGALVARGHARGSPNCSLAVAWSNARTRGSSVLIPYWPLSLIPGSDGSGQLGRLR